MADNNSKVKYYWLGDTLKTTRNKVTKKLVYTKNSVFPNHYGTLYSSKKSAIRAKIRNLKVAIESLECQIENAEGYIALYQRQISKLEKEITK